MKTAVEWFANRISHGGLVSKKQFDELLEQAKEMEKRQRQEDTNYGYSQGWDDGNQNKEPMRPELKQQEQ
jgi:hypothetical protein